MKHLTIFFIIILIGVGCRSGKKMYTVTTKQEGIDLLGEPELSFEVDTLWEGSDSEAYERAYVHHQVAIHTRERIIEIAGRSLLPAPVDFTVKNQAGDIVFFPLSAERMKEIDNNVAKAANAGSLAGNMAVDQDEDLLSKAKELIDSADGYIELSETKKISTKKANANIKPLMRGVDSINRMMSIRGQARLKEYRIARINALIDRKIKRGN